MHLIASIALVFFLQSGSSLGTVTELSVSYLSGSFGGPGTADGFGPEARFNGPRGVWGDGTNLYITDSLNCTIRRVEIASRHVTTFAGRPLLFGQIPVSADGIGEDALFEGPRAIWGDGTSLYVIDSSKVRKIDIASAAVTTIAQLGTLDGVWGDGTSLYVAEILTGPVIRKVDLSTGTVTTIADLGGGVLSDGAGPREVGLWGDTTSLYVASDAIWRIDRATGALSTLAPYTRFSGPRNIWGDGSNLYVTDSFAIRRVTISTGEVTTVAGGPPGRDSVDGAGTNARFNFPHGIWGDGTNLYVADTNNNTIRMIPLSNALVMTIAGAPSVAAYADGSATAARFAFPYDVWGDGTYLYVADMQNNVIRRVEVSTGTATTFAGDGIVSRATFYNPFAVWGDGTNLFVADTSNNLIRKIVIATRQVTTLAGGFNCPESLWGDGTNLFVGDACSFTIRKIVVATGQVTTLAGLADQRGFQDGQGSDARFGFFTGLWGSGGSLYVADQGNHAIRKIETATGQVSTVTKLQPIPSPGAPGTSFFLGPSRLWGDGRNLYMTVASAVMRLNLETGDLTTLAGEPTQRGSEYGTGRAARLFYPEGIWGDGKTLYITDAGTHSIKKLSPVEGGTFEPQLLTHLPAGFYIVEATLAQSASDGFWGLEVLGQTSGGFNLGGGVSAAVPGFGAFYLATPQTVTATATAPLAPTSNLSLVLLDSNHQPIQTGVGGTGSSSLQATLQPGFYVAELTTDNPTPLNYSLALSSDFFGGGVDVGGYIGPGVTGFGAFYLPVEQDVSMRMFGRNTYGSIGAGSLVLTLRDANRNVIQQVGP